MSTPSHTPDADPTSRSLPASRSFADPPTIFEEYERTPLWAALASALADLTASQELVVGTAPHYVLGYLCQELAAKRVVHEAALRQVE